MPDWEERAACAGTSLKLWFGPSEKTERPDQLRWRHRRAAAMCAECTVRSDCLADELARPLAQQHGFRGGLTKRARETLLARWRRTGVIVASPSRLSVEVLRSVLDEPEHQPAVSAVGDGQSQRIQRSIRRR